MIQDCHRVVKCFAYHYCGVSQTITLALPLKLVFSVLELDGQIFGEFAGEVQGQDELQFCVTMQHFTMGISGILGGNGKTPVIGLNKLGKKGIGLFNSIDVEQT